MTAAPDTTGSRRRRCILAVWTRALDGVESVGRVKTARAVRETLAPLGTVTAARLEAVVERASMRSIAAAARALAGGLLRGRPMPLQCVLFADGGPGAEQALRDAAACDVVYADGIRALPWLRRLRQIRPDVEVVLDFDDLMSRRCDELIEHRLPLSLGYLERAMPRAFARIVTAPPVARLLLGYERAALRHAEREALRLADRIVLVNRHEAALLAADAEAMQPPARATVLAIPPPAPVAAAVPVPRPPWRAVFVGTDGLVQNRLTIDHLLELWHRERIAIPLVIYGRQKRPPREVPGVTWAGYVRDIAEAYTPGSILVSPCFLRGGIKTKILEGFAHGTPVVGNTASFEGMDFDGYPLRFDSDAALLGFLADPSRHLGAMVEAVRRGAAHLEHEHRAERFRQRWAAAILGAAGQTATGDGAVPPSNQQRARALALH
jgi:glycosyltransferase involved in cell wall biosynthesis